MIQEQDIKILKKEISDSSLSIQELVYAAYSNASTFRKSDKRGGANGARIALKPQIEWEVNSKYVSKTIEVLKEIQDNFVKNRTDAKRISLSDLIVLGGCVAIKKAIKNAGYDIDVPLSIGRNDTTQELTDVDSFGYLEPVADGFRNYIKKECDLVEEQVLIDKANSLSLNVPQMSVLFAGLRSLGVVYEDGLGVLTSDINTLDNDFFVNLLDMDIEWKRVKTEGREIFEGVDRKNRKALYRATRVDLIFGADSELRAQAEFYAQDDTKEKFIKDFVLTWKKVMELDLVGVEPLKHFKI